MGLRGLSCSSVPGLRIEITNNNKRKINQVHCHCYDVVMNKVILYYRLQGPNCTKKGQVQSEKLMAVRTVLHI